MPPIAGNRGKMETIHTGNSLRGHYWAYAVKSLACPWGTADIGPSTTRACLEHPGHRDRIGIEDAGDGSERK